ncbi:MAG: tyrosine-protein phosphatase [Bacteroidales bacterium]|nr:tyrosine-protein phosphatase [Candidatus Cryptobacteroides aphodequi]
MTKKILAFIAIFISLTLSCGKPATIPVDDPEEQQEEQKDPGKEGEEGKEDEGGEQGQEGQQGQGDEGGEEQGGDTPEPVVIPTDTIDVNIENVWAKEYMDYVYKHPYTTDDFTRTSITRYYTNAKSAGGRGDCPAGAVIEWGAADDEVSYFTVTISENADMSSPVQTVNLSSMTQKFTVTNMIPSRNYYCTVSAVLSDLSSSEVYKALIRPTGRRRMINVESIGNVRDLGGLCTEDGKHIKYGLIYRGSRMSAQGMEINSTDKAELLRIGIRADLDLRQNDKEKLGSDVYTYRRSPLGSDVDWKLFPAANESYFKKLFTNDEYIKALQWLIDELKAGKPVYFHCKTGADRTGTLAFLIESLLDITEVDKSIDFELTSFFYDFGDPKSFAYRSRNIESTIDIAGKDSYDWGGMYNVIKNGCTGSTYQQKVYNYFNKGIGKSGYKTTISSADLDWFISYMLE